MLTFSEVGGICRIKPNEKTVEGSKEVENGMCRRRTDTAWLSSQIEVKICKKEVFEDVHTEVVDQ